jgi:hypothetical protein
VARTLDLWITGLLPIVHAVLLGAPITLSDNHMSCIKEAVAPRGYTSRQREIAL